MRTMFKPLLFVAVLIVAIISIPLLSSESSSQTVKRYTVKLYSENTLVATWEANGPGRVDGTSFVFNVGSDLTPMQVRINGTYSVEQIQ